MKCNQNQKADISNDLVDMKQISIDTNLSKEQKLQQFMQQIHNHYCFRYGDCVVKMNFSNTDITIEHCFEQYLKTLL